MELDPCSQDVTGQDSQEVTPSLNDLTVPPINNSDNNGNSDVQDVTTTKAASDSCSQDIPGQISQEVTPPLNDLIVPLNDNNDNNDNSNAKSTENTSPCGIPDTGLVENREPASESLGSSSYLWLKR